jgi:hypothetical protein
MPTKRLILASIARTFELGCTDNCCGKNFVAGYMKGRSELGSEIPEIIEISVAAIGQGYAETCEYLDA